MHIDKNSEAYTLMMQQLYNYFFAWKTEEDEKLELEASAVENNLTDEQKAEKALQEKNDKRKREEFERDQALFEFE